MACPFPFESSEDDPDLEEGSSNTTTEFGLEELPLLERFLIIVIVPGQEFCCVANDWEACVLDGFVCRGFCTLLLRY